MKISHKGGMKSYYSKLKKKSKQKKYREVDRNLNRDQRVKVRDHRQLIIL